MLLDKSINTGIKYLLEKILKLKSRIEINKLIIKSMLNINKDVVHYINQCFTPNTYIYTKEGCKKISDITINDNVITLDGSFKKINEIIISKIEKEILEIKINDAVNSVKVTKEHQIYIKRNNNEYYINADEIILNDLVGFPINKEINNNILYDNEYCKLYGILIYDSEYIDETFIVKENKYIEDYLIKKNIDYYIDNNKIKWKDNNSIPLIKELLLKKNIHKDILFLSKERILIIIKCLFYKKKSNYINMQIKFMLLKNNLLKSDDNEDNNIIWKKVISIKKINYIGDVYDLNILDNHNYLTEIGIVHNSGKKN